jgi:hypothetical protein
MPMTLTMMSQRSSLSSANAYPVRLACCWAASPRVFVSRSPCPVLVVAPPSDQATNKWQPAQVVSKSGTSA